MDSTGLLRIFKYLSQNTGLLNDFFCENIHKKYFTSKDTILLHAVDNSFLTYCHTSVYHVNENVQNKYLERCFKDHISISNV